MKTHQLMFDTKDVPPIAPGDLRLAVKEAYVIHYATVPVDRLLCRPRDAITFCDVVKANLGAPSLDDEAILKTLMALRKAGEIKTAKG